MIADFVLQLLIDGSNSSTPLVFCLLLAPLLFLSLHGSKLLGGLAVKALLLGSVLRSQ